MILQLPQMLHGRCLLQARKQLHGLLCVGTSRQSSASLLLPQMLRGHRLLLRLQQRCAGTWQATCRLLQQQLQHLLLLVTCRCAC